ncbi:MAG: DRTGG domain-containing protein [Bacillota bacterium]
MLLRDICEKLDLKVLAGSTAMDNEIEGVYICDLLSWVMAHAKKNDAWITVMTHSNIIAVASLLELGCIIVPEDIEVEADSLTKADEEGIPVLSSSRSSFNIAVALHTLGIGK